MNNAVTKKKSLKKEIRSTTKAIITSAENDINKWIYVYFWWKCELPQTFRLNNLATCTTFLKKHLRFPWSCNLGSFGNLSCRHKSFSIYGPMHKAFMKALFIVVNKVENKNNNKNTNS